MSTDLREQSEDLMRGAVKSAASVLSFCSGVLLTVSDHILAPPDRPWSVPHQEPQTGPTDPAEVESFLDRFFVAEKAGVDFTAATFVLVRGGRVFFQKSYGAPSGTTDAPLPPGYTGGLLLGAADQVGRLLSAMLTTGREGLRRVGQELPGVRMFRQHFAQHPEVPDAVYDLLETYTHQQRTLIHTGGQDARSLIYLLPDQDLGFYLLIRGADPKTNFRLRTRLVQKFLDRYYPLD